MSVREVGSYIGYNRVTSTSQDSASGIWSLAAAERRRRADAWPKFLPSNITGLQLWLDASDASTLYDATTGGSLVAADGGVARWEDKSGNARHATQGTSANRPARKTAIQGGLDVLRFDGSNDRLDISSAILGAGASPVSIIAVVSMTSLSGFPVLVEIGTNPRPGVADTSGYAFLPGLMADNSGMYFANVGGNNERFTANGTISTANWYALSVVALGSAFSSSNPTFFKNGVSQASTQGAGTSTPDITGSNVTRIGCSFVGGAGNFVSGDIAEILIYDSALSDTDRAAVENYLLAKWAIT